MQIGYFQKLVKSVIYIAECTNATVTGMTESKLVKSIFQWEIQIDDLFQCDRNRNTRGIACYISSGIFFEILLPKTTPMIVGIMYRPPSQTNFLEISNMTFENIDVDKKRHTYSCQFQHKHVL